MARRPDAECGLDFALARIAGKWKPTLLWLMHAGPLHFGELRRAAGLSEKVLMEQLQALEADGLVTRSAYEEGRVQRVAYALTPSGAALNDAVHQLSEWAQAHRPPAQ